MRNLKHMLGGASLEWKAHLFIIRWTEALDVWKLFSCFHAAFTENFHINSMMSHTSS